jgi:hypothetical protein
MARENPRKSERENQEGGDSPELDLDGAESVPNQGRIPTEKVKNLDEISIRRSANTGDIVDDAGDDDQKRILKELKFSRNEDFQGNEGKLRTDADYSRGSGWLGGKLWGEEELGYSSNENTPLEEAAPKGFDLTESQRRNREAIAREGGGEDVSEEDSEKDSEKGGQKGEDGPAMQGDLRDQGRDLGRRDRITATQAFGRDVGVSGLPETGYDDVEETLRLRAAQAAHSSDWTAVLLKLGGGSPGSEENLMLSEKFSGVKFPSSPEEILHKLPPEPFFKKGPVSIDLREAVAASRLDRFRSMNDLIDCVKDAIREAEHREFHPTQTQ